MLPDQVRNAMQIPRNHALWGLISAGVGFGGTAADAGPKFSCPSCRLDVKSRPVECFKLKDVTRALGDVIGESDPAEKDKRGAKGGSKGKGKVTGDAVWDAYFGNGK